MTRGRWADCSGAEPQPPPRAKWAGDVRQAWRARLLQLLTVIAPGLLSGALRLLGRTLRTTVINGEELAARWGRGERVIVAFWHNRLAMMPIAAGGRRFCILNSQHRDGEIATRALTHWGIRSVRGSTTKGGVKGFLQLVAAYRQGYNLAVVPDGPRGPRYTAKPGVIHLAKATGAVIVPVTFAASRATRLRSWDQLIIPLPFARIVLAFGEPLAVPRHCDAAQLERHRETLERRLNDLTRAAESSLAA